MPRFLLSLLTSIGILLHGSFGVVGGNIEFIENLGQWDSRVNFKVQLSAGAVFFEDNCFTYNLLDLDVIRHAHSKREPLPEYMKGHAFKVSFVGALANTVSTGDGRSTHYRNYFIGNDESKWAGHVHSYAKINYQQLYQGIGLTVYGRHGNLKYDLLVEPMAAPSIIRMDLDGHYGVELRPNGDLVVRTSLMDIT